MKHRNIALLCMVVVFGVSSAQAAEKRYASPSEYPVQVYWGDPHIHTRISADAAMWGTLLGPEETYRFGRGEAMTSHKGWKVKLKRPLDWMVISDHSDAWGFYERIVDGDPYVLAEPEGVRWHNMIKEGKSASTFKAA